MVIRGRTLLAAIVASSILLLFSTAAFPSTNTEAGHKLSVARERLADLKRSPKKTKYRSYWMDSIRMFELVEKKYPGSPAAADACFERAAAYGDLYQHNQHSRDLDESRKTFAKCQSSYPKHERGPEALYRIIVIFKDRKKDNPAALETYRKMAELYPDSAWTDKAKVRLGIRTAAKNGKIGKNGKKKKKETELRKPPESVIAVPTAPKELGVVKNVRYWSGGAYTRIVIDQDRTLKFQAHELKNPDRLVFDILSSRVSDSVDKDPLPVNDGILKQVRTSQYAPDTVRVVLDLASLKSYAAFPLHEPDRLVIDVTGTGDPDEPAEAGPATQQTDTRQGTVIEAKGDDQPKPALPPFPKEPILPKRFSKRGGGDSISLSQQIGLKIATIAIDAGHGGRDPGAMGRGGLKEKEVTLDIARRLAALVKERLGRKVIMTRDKDVYIPLEERPFIAKSKGADLFVSIHVNANRKRKARGIETYIQGLRASDTEAMATAARENAMSTRRLSELKDELSKILKDLATDDKSEESLHLAHAVQGSLVSTVKQTQKKGVDRGKVKRAFFYVLVNTQMPSILAEVGFISNAEEEALLRKDAYRQKLAEALFQGIKRYVESRDPVI
ncbi:MAG: N-acetylmuramoyl-L-alanine amidase [Nitrospirota bacterium]